MTVPNTVNAVRYVATGSESSFPYTFRIFQDSDLVVQTMDTSGNITTLVLNTDYTVTGALSYTGGTVTLTAGNLTAGYTFLAYRDPEQVQDTSLQDQGTYRATTVEDALDLLTMETQSLQRQTTVAIQAPPVDVDPQMELPVAALRANKFVAFDSYGDLAVTAVMPSTATVTSVLNVNALKNLPTPVTSTVYATTGYYTNGDGGGGFYFWNSIDTRADNGGTIIALAGGGTGRFNLVDNGGILNARQFGCLGDGSTDDTAAIEKMVGAITDFSQVYFPSGTYSISSATLAGSYLNVSANGVVIYGDGKNDSIITVAGSSVMSAIFSCTDKSGFTVHSLGFIGNSQANAFANGAAIYWQAAAASAEILDFTVRDCHFENFKGDYWIYIANNNTQAMRGVYVTGNTFVSKAGNARGPANIAINSAFVLCYGNPASAAGPIQNVWIQNNDMRADYIKCGPQIFGNVQYVWIEDNRVANAGSSGISADTGAYAIICYNNSNAGAYPPKYVTIRANMVINPLSCGIYCTSSPYINCYDNIISGQSDNTITSIPKGAIVFNGCQYVQVRGGQLDSNGYGIYFQGLASSAEGHCLIDNVQILNSTVAAVKIESTNAWKDVQITGCTIQSTTGRAIWFNPSATITDIRVQGNHLSAPVSEVEFTGNFSANVRVSGNHLIGNSNFGIEVAGNTNDFSIDDNDFFGTFAPGINFTSCTKGAITGNRFYDQPNTGGFYCIDLTSSTPGPSNVVVESNQFVNCTAANQMNPAAFRVLVGRPMTVSWQSAAAVTVASTAAETTLLDAGASTGTKVFPAGYWYAGRTVRFKASGVFSNLVGATQQWKAKFGTVALADSGAVAVVGTLTGAYWDAEVTVTCLTTGAAGTFAVGMRISYANGNTQQIVGVSTAAAVIDTTTSETFDFTIQWGASSASNTITRRTGTLETLG